VLHENTPDPTDRTNEEIRSTLRDLVSAFGESTVTSVLTDEGLIHPESAAHNSQTEALRAYTVLLLDAKHPRAVAQIVGRLCHVDTASGTELRQEDIAREIGISKQAVCNLESSIATRLGLPRLSSEKSRRSSRLMNRRNITAHADP
jgi:hypothetical protein